jgi:hypothetical protein
MAITKVTTPDLINLTYNNTDGVILPKGATIATFSCDYLVLAGGGGGGAYAFGGGGGGAGGLLTTYATSPVTDSGSETKLDLSIGVAYDLTVGAGGSGVSTDTYGNNGNNSVFSNITAIAGGGGGGGANPPDGAGGNFSGRNGGSGGGGGPWDVGQGAGGTATTGQGFAGGTGTSTGSCASGCGGGGGGGASSVGTAASASSGGNGGSGVSVSITGSSVSYAGGGGGQLKKSSSFLPGTGGSSIGGDGGATGGNGSVNTGSGGGGGVSSSGSGGNGGSGVVVIRVPTGITATFSGGVTANGSTGGTIAPDTSTGDNIWIVTATTDASQTITFSGTLSGGRPASPVDGEFRYNTTDKKVEYYDGSNWYQLSSSTIVPQSGTTGACNYPVTNTAMYLFDSNANNNSVCATSGSYNGTERGITYTTGKFNNAATYSSSDWNASTGSQIYIDNSVWGGNTSTFSFSEWIKTNGPHVNTTQGYEIPILGNGGTIGSTTGFAIYMQAGKLSGTLCSTALGTGQVFFGNTTAIDDSAWHHVAFTFDDSSGAYILYLDGASYASGTSSTAFRGNPTPTYNTYIGNRWNRNENGVFPGQIDQLRIFANTVLTATQVSALYTETAP